jgi:hypothetical protein
VATTPTSAPELGLASDRGGEQKRVQQQVQRYESTGYGSARLARLCDVVAALGLDVHEVVTLGRIDAA